LPAAAAIDRAESPAGREPDDRARTSARRHLQGHRGHRPGRNARVARRTRRPEGPGKAWSDPSARTAASV